MGIEATTFARGPASAEVRPHHSSNEAARSGTGSSLTTTSASPASASTDPSRSASASANGPGIPGGGIGLPTCPVTMAAIAAGAGVALKTVYVAFETKGGVLRALWQLLLRGDQDDIPVGERRGYLELLDEPDPERQLRRHLLVGEPGWTPEDYETWCADSACTQLLRATTSRYS